MLRIILISILICLSYLTIPTSAANKYYDGESRPYEFGFKIENNQHRHEKRTENGLIMGEFGFVTADGIYHATVYATDEKGSFQIVSMQNLKVEEIADLFNIPPPAPTKKFEIVPLKAATPPRYNSVETTSKLNAPLIQTKSVVDIKTCSTCKVPTTKRPIPITLAPVQHNKQKPFGIGLPEKLTTYRHYDVTPKQIVPSINHVDIKISEPGREDDHLQVRAPEDQTLPIGKSSITPTHSTFATRPLQNHQPVTDQLISIVKDSIQKVSLQQSNIAAQSPEMAQVIQKAGATKPSLRGPIHKQSQSLQNIPTASPGPELLQTIQPSLLDNEPVEQPHMHIKPSSESKSIGAIRELNRNEQPVVQIQVSTQSQTNKPNQQVSPVRDSLQNVQGQHPQNIPIEQLEVSPDPSPPRLSQPKLVPDRGSKQFSLPKIPENTPVEITPKYTKLTTPSQNQFERPAAPIIESVQKVQPQTLAERPVEESTVFRGPSASIQTQFGDPVIGNLQSPHSQSPHITAINNPTVSKIPSRGSTQFQSNGPLSPVKESLSLSQPPLPQNGVDQSVQYREPSKPTLAQTQNPVDREREYVQNLQPHISPNIPATQPEAHIKQSAPVKIQFEISASPISGSLQNVQPLSPQNAPNEQPALNRRSGSIQTKFINPVSSVNTGLPDPQSQLPPKAVTDQPTVRASVLLETPAKQVSAFNEPSLKTQNLRGPGTTSPQPHNEVGTSTVSNTPSRLVQVQSDDSPTPIRESLLISQPLLPQNGAGQSVEHREPQKPTLHQSQSPPNIPADQPGEHLKQSTPVQIQFETPASPISGPLQKVQPLSPQNAPFEQPSAFNGPSGPIQTKLINPVSSVNADLPNPQLQLPPQAITDQPTIRKSGPLETPAEQAFNGLSVKTDNLRAPGTSTPQPHNEDGSSTVSNLPSKLAQVNSDGSPNPIRASLPLSQPPLPQNGADQSVEYREPTKPTLNQSQNPADREREYVQNLLPHISTNIPAEQPGVQIKQSTPAQIQFERPASRISGSVEYVQPLSQQNAPFEQPSALNRPSGPIQTKFINPVSSVNANLPDPQSQLLTQAVTDQPSVRKSVPLEISAEKSFNGPSVKTQTLRGPDTSIPQPHNVVGNSTVSNIPSKLAQVNSDGSPNVLRESIPISQPPLPQNGPVDQSLVNQELSKPTLTLSPNPLDRERDSAQNIKPQVTQNIVADRPVIHTINTTTSQDQSSESVRPLQGPVQNTRPNHVPVQQLPVLSNQIVPNKYETNNPANINSKPASPLGTHTQLNVPTTSKSDETLPDIHSPIKTGVLVIEPLSPAPEIRINLPKQLLNSVPRQIDSVHSKQAILPPLQTGKLLNELKEIMLNHKIKPAQLGGAVPLERIGNFDKELNVAQPLGSILYRFNYTAGYHGHHEQGDQGGNKEGGYYLISRDGYRRIVDYAANEDGYRPKIHIEYAQPQDVPQPETEKEKGLGGYEFKWFYV